MRIIYVVPSLKEGGTEISAIARLNFLASKFNIDIYLVVLSNEIPLSRNIKKLANLRLLTLNLKDTESLTKKAFIKSFVNYKPLLRLIKQINPNIIISSLPISHQLCRLALLNIKLKERPKLIIYHHAPQYKENPINNILKKILNKQVQLLNFLDDAHISVAKAVEKDLKRYLKMKKSRVIYNGLEDKYQDVKREGSEFSKYDFNIVMPGRLVPVKGHLRALKVLLPLLVKHDDIKIWIIGEGEERNNIKNYLEENDLQMKVILLGKLLNIELLNYIYNANLVLIPSFSEGIGNVAIESMMMGNFVICSNVGGLPEVINDPRLGFLFESNNPSEILSLVQKVYNGEVFIDKVFIRKSFQERFLLENHVKEFYQFLKEI